MIDCLEPENIGLANWCDVNAGWNRPSQIELRMQLDSSFGAAKIAPPEECQGEINRCGVQSVKPCSPAPIRDPLPRREREPCA